MPVKLWAYIATELRSRRGSGLGAVVRTGRNGWSKVRAGILTGSGRRFCKVIRAELTFHAAPHLVDDEVESMVHHIRALVFGHLQRRGYLDEDAVLVEEADAESELDELRTHHAAAIQGLIPFGGVVA